MTATVDTERKRAPLWWRVARGTIRGTATVARITYIEGRYTYGVTKTRTQARYQAWKARRTFAVDDQPELDEIPHGRRRLLRPQYVCLVCSRKYGTTRGLNTHFTTVHGHETPRVQNQSPARVRGFTSTSRNRRHPSYPAPPPTPAKNTRSANPMNSTIAQALRAAWGRMAEARPYKLSEIRDDMVGLEQVLGGSACEAVEAYRNHLVRNVKFNPVTVRHLNQVKDLLEEAGKVASAVIATIESDYAAEIAAARKRAGGVQPSDKTLSS